ncbi:MAG: hypothetical protein GY722_11530 [bacterium]|nr:hypothetical protein [bacterium]
MPIRPTAAQIKQAKRLLLKPFADFPFAAESDRAAAVAVVLTIAARQAIDGPCPLFGLSANAPGTGKGLLANVIAGMAMGRRPSYFTAPRDDSEMDKRIFSIALEGHRVVLFDNIEGALGSSSLALALTTTTMSGRVLGQSRTVTVPFNVVFLATGNNLSFRGDLGRRVLPVDQRTDLEHPEDRSGFEFRDLLGHVLEQHPRYLIAALTVLRGFILADRPSHGMPPKGSFESWDHLVRATVISLGLGDPVAGCSRVRGDADLELVTWTQALDTLSQISEGRPFTVMMLMGTATSSGWINSNPELGTALATLARKPESELNGQTVGQVFKRFQDRVAGGRRLVRLGTGHGGGANWCVESTASVQGSR